MDPRAYAAFLENIPASDGVVQLPRNRNKQRIVRAG
jgi:hypothetical protein